MSASDTDKPLLCHRHAASLHNLLCFAAVFVVIELAHGYGLEWLRWGVSAELCPPFAEGQRWWSGHLDLSERLWDTAVDPGTGKVFNVFPPLLPILSFFATAPLPGRETPATWPEILPLLLLGLPLPLLAFVVFVRRANGAFWGAVLTRGFLGGTACCRACTTGAGAGPTR